MIFSRKSTIASMIFLASLTSGWAEASSVATPSPDEVLEAYGATLGGKEILFGVTTNKPSVRRVNLLKKADMQPDVRVLLAMKSPCGMQAYQAMAVSPRPDYTVYVTYSCAGKCSSVAETYDKSPKGGGKLSAVSASVDLPEAFCKKLWGGSLPLIDEGL